MAFSRQPLLRESVSAVTTTASVDLGTRRVVDGSEYVYMYNGGTVADQRLVVRPLTAGTSYTFSVTTVSNSVQPICGTVANATCAASSYCWVLTKGYTKGILASEQTMAVGGAAAPVRIVTGADGTITIATGGTGSTGASIGFLTSAISDVTGTSVGVYIRSRF
jgi:hypothetical protein